MSQETTEAPFNGEELKKFKDLVFSEEHHTLDSLQDRLKTVSDVNYFGENLPEAISKSHTGAGEKLVDSLQRPVVEAVKQSATKDRKNLSAALYPVMGPAIRLYVGELFRGLVDQLNDSIKSATSINQIRWRIEAKLMGKSFSEYVLLKTLSYRVDRVLLVESASGLLMHQVARLDSEQENPELVSSMLVAIRSFVKDSFGDASDFEDGQEGDSDLGRFTFGDKEIFVEAGPKAILAAVGIGTPPPSFRQAMGSVLEDIHVEYSDQLSEYSGDTESLAALEPSLNTLLVENRASNDENANPWPARLAMGGTVAAILGFWGFNIFADYQWGKTIKALRAEPGIEVVHHDRSLLNRKEVRVLQDPLATSASEVLVEVGENVEKIGLEIAPYISAEPVFAEQRRQVLAQDIEDLQRNLEEGLDGFASKSGLVGVSDSLKTFIEAQEAEMKKAREQIDEITVSFFYERFDPERKNLRVGRNETGWMVDGEVDYKVMESIREEADSFFYGAPVDLTRLGDTTDRKLNALQKKIGENVIHFEIGKAKVSPAGREARFALYKLIEEFEAIHEDAGRIPPKYIIKASALTGVMTESSPEIARERIEGEMNQLRLFEMPVGRIRQNEELIDKLGRKGVWVEAIPSREKSAPSLKK